jgi:hypothetical protein
MQRCRCPPADTVPERPSDRGERDCTAGLAMTIQIVAKQSSAPVAPDAWSVAKAQPQSKKARGAKQSSSVGAGLRDVRLRLQPSHNLRMEVRLIGVLEGFGLHHDGMDHIGLRVEGPRRIRVQLWTDRTTNTPRMRYRAKATFDSPAGVQRMFESLAAGRYPHGSRPQITLASGAVATSGRAVVGLAAMSLMPEPFREFVDALGDDLTGAATCATARPAPPG